MDRTFLKTILAPYKNKKNEEQILFVFNNNRLIKSVSLSSTDFENVGVTDFRKLSCLENFSNQSDAYSFYIVHNHPEGTATPSQADFENYRFLFYLCSFFNIEISDYLIVSKYGFFSFKNKNFLLEFKPHTFINANKENSVFDFSSDFRLSSIKSSFSDYMNESESKIFISTPDFFYDIQNLNFDFILSFLNEDFVDDGRFIIFSKADDCFNSILYNVLSPIDVIKI